MVLIILFGVYSDTPQESVANLMVAHSILGWLICLGWIALFWGLVFRFVVRPSVPEEQGGVPATKGPSVKKRGVLCGICEDPLTPALPGYRCECGRFYHVACAATVVECPSRHRPMKVTVWMGGRHVPPYASSGLH